MRNLKLNRPVYPATISGSSARRDFATPTAEETGFLDQDAKSIRVTVTARPNLDSGKFIKPEPHQRFTPTMNRQNRWGIVLAGGDGVRLRELTRWFCGDDRPKQFCQLLSERSLVEEARRRAERCLPAKQILFSVTRAHEKYYHHQLADRASQTIVQPANKGTAPAILYALMHIAQTDPRAIVSVLPSDHYYSPESGFTEILESAFTVAGQRTDAVVLLGAQPSGPETEYGWIEMGPGIDGHPGLFRVQGFREKPPLGVARNLYRNGSLWNTFVMVGHVRAFLELARTTVPGLLQKLESSEVKSSPGSEIQISESSYYKIAPIDFSREILMPAPDRLLTLPLGNVYWSDLGDPYRVLVTLLEATGGLPEWAKLWPDPEPSPRAAAAMP